MTSGQNGRRGRCALRCLSAAAAALLFAGSLAACGPADSGLKQDTAAKLQQRVLSVSQAAAGNDPTGALNELTALEADLAAATDNGTVSDARRRSITTAVAAVRADLNDVLAAAAAAAKTAEDAAAAQRQAEADATAAAAAAAAAEANNAAPAPVAPAPAPAQNNGKAGKGKGKDG
ncbi:hypothetical protein PY310_03325 [Pseudarthrobacter sp. H3Y2-7]|uniref:hypothetical protein n=1 Tax=Pseudarthrobacter naphthalenicus TaxID=3031328 RepID=UPI0023AFE274|nr:hypothetical protein [Pseudarthrobacter sp. H3Y2-7]MDE8667610.1 hypothetical protein [Pseudarthrobacter sp. H3Y2-7]